MIESGVTALTVLALLHFDCLDIDRSIATHTIVKG
jgi:hypothetical protein